MNEKIMPDAPTKFLNKVDTPYDLRKLEVKDLRTLSKEIREFLVDSISKTGGHLGAGLGAVELAVALHYVFDTPKDKLVWDVGHQAYPHKILTGRKDRLHTIRQLHGISGFLKRSESEYDTFGAGHASTAISAALGMATARDFNHENYKVVAIVGDGSMTGGMAYEAMNNAGLLKKDMIVVLNDNRMVSLSSVAPNLWSFHNYFAEVLTHPSYNKFKSNVWDLTGKLDTFGDRLRSVAQNVEKGLKAVITPGMLFEALGFRYFGPFNGHNVVKLVEILRHVKDLKGPILIHAITEKGKGVRTGREGGDTASWRHPVRQSHRNFTEESECSPRIYGDLRGRARRDLQAKSESCRHHCCNARWNGIDRSAESNARTLLRCRELRNSMR